MSTELSEVKEVLSEAPHGGLRLQVDEHRLLAPVSAVEGAAGRIPARFLRLRSRPGNTQQHTTMRGQQRTREHCKHFQTGFYLPGGISPVGSVAQPVAQPGFKPVAQLVPRVEQGGPLPLSWPGVPRPVHHPGVVHPQVAEMFK